MTSPLSMYWLSATAQAAYADLEGGVKGDTMSSLCVKQLQKESGN